MALPGFIFGGDGMPKTPEELARARAIAEALLMPQRPAQNVGEGLAVLGQAIRGRREMNAANRAQAAGDASAQSAISAALGGGMFPSAPGGGASPASADASGGGSNYRDAIAGIESAGSGDYSAVGPTNSKLGRALGRYQVMEGNLPSWSQEALGRTVTPQEFLADPKLQDAIFDHKFGSYVQQYGPEGAAQAWFAGPGGVGKLDRKDVLGTDVGSYGRKFMSALGGSAPVQVASTDPSAGIAQALGAAGPQAAPSPVAAALQLPQQGPIPQARPDVVAALNGAAPPPGAVGGAEATTPAGQRVLGQMMSPLPMGGNPMQMQPPEGAAPAPSPDQSGKPQGPGTPGEIRKGADGKTYQYAQTTGMAGATGDQGWIETSMPAQGGGQPAPDNLPVMAGGSADAVQPGQGGPSVEQLMQAAQNPWLRPEQRQLVNGLLAQKMKQNDPATLLEMEKNRLEMEKTRIETERLRNPQMSPAEKARLDLDTQKFQADQKKLMELSPGTTVFDPATRAPVFSAPKQESKPAGVQEYEYAKSQGFPGTYADWEASKKGGMSLQVDPDTGAVTFQQGGNIKPMTEGQSKDTTFAVRAEGALPNIDKFGDALTSLQDSAGGKVPVIGNYLKSPEYQQGEQAGKEFLQAILRKDTGAAITPQETEEYGTVYLPRPGDSPEVLAQKKASRARALDALKAGMTPQALLAQEQALKKEGNTAAPAPAPTAPAPGKKTVIDGYTIEEVP